MSSHGYAHILGVLEDRRDEVQVDQQKVEVGCHDVVDGHGAGFSARAAGVVHARAGVEGYPCRTGIAEDVPSRLRGEKGQPPHELRQDDDVALSGKR